MAPDSWSWAQSSRHNASVQQSYGPVGITQEYHLTLKYPMCEGRRVALPTTLAISTMKIESLIQALVA
jgi:hypothetical protein